MLAILVVDDDCVDGISANYPIEGHVMIACQCVMRSVWSHPLDGSSSMDVREVGKISAILTFLVDR